MGDTLFGLLGFPVQHSISPAMMNAAFRHIRQGGVYMPFHVPPEELEIAVKGLQTLGARGVNVTIPHKETVLKFVDELTDEARLVGAVNTIRFDRDPNRVIGHNTDVTGWWSSVERWLQPNMTHAVILGSGGAARAVLAALALHASHMTVSLVARNPVKADVMVRDFGKLMHMETVSWDRRYEVTRQGDLVVNTTPMGMWPHTDESPITDDTCFHKSQVVQDVVYRPLETKFMAQAREQGATVVDGLHMLINQGAEAFEFWTGHDAPRGVMTEAARRALHS